jgi:hypothetical protein
VWLLNRPRIPGHRKLARNIYSDIVVVGALIADRLTELGMQVTIIDATSGEEARWPVQRSCRMSRMSIS